MALLWRQASLRGALIALTILLAGRLAAAQSIAMDYCATINTGSTPGNRSDWQSDGLCHNFCIDGSYALAIVRGNYCWCSNFVPSSSAQVPLSRCRDPCPGFPPDVCGGSGTWGYMRLRVAPSGTTAVGISETSTMRESTSNRQTLSVQTVTVNGVVQTVTSIAPGGSSDSAGQQTVNNSGGGSLSTGAAVGLAVGIVAVLGIGGIIGFLVLRKRRRDKAAMFEESMTPKGSLPPMAQSPTAGGLRESGWRGRKPGGRSDSDNSGGRRSSVLMPSDPRMNGTHGIYLRPDNKSHDSFLSMQDNRDYSRPVHEPKKVLRVTNANPEEDPS